MLGDSDDYGELSCDDCPNPVYSATAPSPSCGHYGVVMRASYDGLLTDMFWIFNNSPYNLHYIAYDDGDLGQGGGGESIQTLKVRDICGGGMWWVEVNEEFSNEQFDYPDPTSGWDLFGWNPGVWEEEGKFSGAGDFYDTMFEETGPGKYPQPMDTGANGYSEAGEHTVMHATQDFRAGSSQTGSGQHVQQTTQTHYLDHGAN